MRECTSSWKAESASPFSQLKAKKSRSATQAAAKYSVRLPRSMARREPPMPLRSRELRRWCWRAPLSVTSSKLDPSWPKQLSTFVCHRLRVTSDQVEAIVLHSVDVRLARFLLAAIALKGQGKAGTQPIVLDLGMSQTELGLLLGASRSRVNEALAALEKLGAVRHTGSHIECDVGALQNVAQGD